MQTREVKEAVETLFTGFEELKKDLKDKHEKLASKEHVDALLLAKMERVNEAITKAETAIDAAEKAQAISKAMRNAADDYDEAVKVGKRKKTDPEVRKAFINFIRKGEEGLTVKEKELLETHKKSMSSGSDPQGGFVVLPEMDNMIERILYETSPMRKLCETKQISTDQFERLVRVDLAQAYWDDRDTTDQQTATPTYQKLSVKANKLTAEPLISQDLIDDAFVDVEDEVTMSLAESFELAENTSFVSGNGVGQPRGILTYPAGSWDDATPNLPVWNTIEQIHSGNASALTYAGLVNLTYSLKDGYLPRAVFLANRLTVGQLRLLTDGEGRPLWTPGFGSEPAQIMGYPIIRASDMPIVASNSLSIAFGDFSRAYIIIDRIGTRVLRDPFTQKPFIKFYTTKRVGGGMKNFESIKIQVTAA